MATSWEYLTERLVAASGDKQAERLHAPTLKMLGALGWELIYVHKSECAQWPGDRIGLWLHDAVFKRPAPPSDSSPKV